MSQHLQELVKRLQAIVAKTSLDTRAIDIVLRKLENVSVTKIHLHESGAGKILRRVQKTLAQPNHAAHAGRIIAKWKKDIENERQFNAVNETLQKNPTHRAISISHVDAQRRNRVVSLESMCLSVLRCNIAKIGHVGAVPSHFIIDVLAHANAVQLARIEDMNPHLQADTAIVWKRLCKHDFPRHFEACQNEQKIQNNGWRMFYENIVKSRLQREKDYESRLCQRVKKDKESRSSNSAQRVHILKQPTKKRRRTSLTQSSVRKSHSSRLRSSPVKGAKTLMSNIRRQIQERSRMEKTYDRDLKRRQSGL